MKDKTLRVSGEAHEGFTKLKYQTKRPIKKLVDESVDLLKKEERKKQTRR